MLRFSNHHFSKSIAVLLLIEFLLLILSVCLGESIRFPEQQLSLQRLWEIAAPALIFVISMMLGMSTSGMYQRNLDGPFWLTIARLFPSNLLAFCLLSVTFFIAPSFQIGRGVTAIIFAIAGVGIFGTRFIFHNLKKIGIFKSRLLVLGAGELAKSCGELASCGKSNGDYNIVGYIPFGAEKCCIPNKLLLKENKTLQEIIRKHRVTDVIVALQDRRVGDFPTQELLNCKLSGTQIIDSSLFFEREACQIRVKSLQPSWLIFGDGFNQSFRRMAFKRAFDLLFSLIFAVFMIPIILITSVFIYLEDRGPIFYSQERVGIAGKKYKMYKFRSMQLNAELFGTPKWASRNDPRTTNVGAVIRKLRIDELPQLFNVVRGEMSFVGPRPERPYFVEQLVESIPYYNARHSIKPGISILSTCWKQQAQNGIFYLSGLASLVATALALIRIT